MPPTFSTPYVSALSTFYNKIGGPAYNAMTSTAHASAPSLLLSSLPPALLPGASLLDLATGTGKVALAAAHAVGPTGHVLGIDVSDALLSQATASAREQGLSSRVTFLQRDVARLDLPPETYPPRWADAVTCGSALGMFPDKKGVLGGLAREVLRPGGWVVADAWGPMVPAQIFLEVAVPRGYVGAFEPEWVVDTERAVREVFEGVEGLEVVSVEAGGRNEVKFKAGSEEEVEGLWRSMAEEQTWLSYGLGELGEGVRAEIKRAWVERVKERRDGEGVLRGEIRQWIAVARVRE